MDVTELLKTPEAIVEPRKKTPHKRRPKAKPKAKKKVARKHKAKTGTAERSGRLDMRLTKAEKARIIAKAKKARRTVTSLVIEAIEKIK